MRSCILSLIPGVQQVLRKHWLFCCQQPVCTPVFTLLISICKAFSCQPQNVSVRVGHGSPFKTFLKDYFFQSILKFTAKLRGRHRDSPTEPPSLALIHNQRTPHISTSHLRKLRLQESQIPGLENFFLIFTGIQLTYIPVSFRCITV